MIAFVVALAGRVGGAEPSPGAKFLGPQTCTSSSCHGGADEKSNQYLVWSTRDYHYLRPFATLTTARSERIAAVLNIGDPTQSDRCTACHAPFQPVPAENYGSEADPHWMIHSGISCETCHGPAENWLRSHTRKDYTHADRLASGMRDTKSLYGRANVCVACHQNVPADVIAAGHPELIFDLDGQSVTEPKHWSKSDNGPGPQVWLVGQAAALREMSWQLSNETGAQTNLEQRWAGLFWALSQVQDAGDGWPAAPTIGKNSSTDQFELVRKWSDSLARAVSDAAWTDELTRKCAAKLAGAADAFYETELPARAQARRAERLVLALDRLTLGLTHANRDPKVEEALNRLFADAQSVPDFDPNQFANDLKEFHSRVTGILEAK